MVFTSLLFRTNTSFLYSSHSSLLSAIFTVRVPPAALALAVNIKPVESEKVGGWALPSSPGGVVGSGGAIVTGALAAM